MFSRGIDDYQEAPQGCELGVPRDELLDRLGEVQCMIAGADCVDVEQSLSKSLVIGQSSGSEDGSFTGFASITKQGSSASQWLSEIQCPLMTGTWTAQVCSKT